MPTVDLALSNFRQTNFPLTNTVIVGADPFDPDSATYAEFTADVASDGAGYQGEIVCDVAPIPDLIGVTSVTVTGSVTLSATGTLPPTVAYEFSNFFYTGNFDVYYLGFNTVGGSSEVLAFPTGGSHAIADANPTHPVPASLTAFLQVGGGLVCYRTPYFSETSFRPSKYITRITELKITVAYLVAAEAVLRRYPRDDGRGFGGVKRNYPQSKASRNVGGQP